jgi:acyl carrier protein
MLSIPTQSKEIVIRALLANPLVFRTREELHKLIYAELDSSFVDLGMDSLGCMELSIWLEVELNLEVTESEIQEISTAAKLANFLKLKLNLPS